MLDTTDPFPCKFIRLSPRGRLRRLAPSLFWLLFGVLAFAAWGAGHLLGLARWSWRRRAWLSACGALLFAVWIGWRWWAARGWFACSLSWRRDQ